MATDHLGPAARLSTHPTLLRALQLLLSPLHYSPRMAPTMEPLPAHSCASVRCVTASAVAGGGSQVGGEWDGAG